MHDIFSLHNFRLLFLMLIGTSVCIIMAACTRGSGDPELYLKYCAACHGPDGEGLRSLYPPLQDSIYLAQQIDKLPCLITNGVKSTINTTGSTSKMRMPSFSNLNLDEMTDLITYLHTTWGPGDKTPLKQDVETWLQSCR